MSTPQPAGPTRPSPPAPSRSGLPVPTDPAVAADLVWRELEDRFGWYDRNADRNQQAYRTLKVVVLLLGAVVTVLAASGAPALSTAICAAGVVVAEGLQQVFQFHTNWINYRAAAEALRQHAFLYAAGTSRYANPDTRRDLLATTLQELITTENTGWTSLMRTPSPSPGTSASAAGRPPA